MALDSNFNIQISAIVNANKLRQSVESALKKEFEIKIKAQTSGVSTGGQSSIVGSAKTKASGIDATARQAANASKAVDNFNTKLINLRTTGGLTEKQFQTFNSRLSSINTEFSNTKNLENFNSEMHKLKNEVSQVSTKTKAAGQSVVDISAKFTQWYLIAGLVTGAINKVKDVVVQIKVLDSVLVELNKVSDLTETQLKDLTNWSFKLGEQAGKTGDQVIGAVTEFKRAGYTIQESMALAETALIMTNVAEGITDAGTAANYLVSILKGANLEISYSNKLLDELNEISNTSAINFDSLADMTQRIAGTMSTLGNSVEETMALITGAYEVLQDERVAKGLSTIGLRISGLNEDLEREAGLQSNVNKALMEYAGISIFDNTRQLRDTYDILEDLASVWGSLNKNVQTYLTTTLAGKNRADVLAAVLSNWAGVENAMASAMNSAGSSLEEQQAYLDSIEGKQQELANAWQELADATLDTDIVKFFYDLFTWVTKLTTRMGGLLPVVGSLLGIIIAINAQKFAEKIMGWGSAIKNLGTMLKSATTSAQKFQLALGWIGIAVTAVSAIAGAIKGVINANEERAEAEREAQKEAVANTDETISKLEDVKNRYIELSENTKRTAEEEQELLDIQESLIQNYGYLKKGLDEVNGSYEEYLELTEEAILQQKKEKYAAMASLYKEAVEGKKSLLSGREKEYSGRYYKKRILKGRKGFRTVTRETDLSEISLESIQDRIDALVSKNLTSFLTDAEASELSWLQSYISSINSQLEEYNNTIEEREALGKEINQQLKDEIDGTAEYNKQLSLLKGNLNSIINSLEDRIALDKEENEELEKQQKLQDKLLKVEEARLALAEARNKQVRVFRAGQGFVYESDQSEVQSAQESLTKALSDLSEYKYELALENAENFVSELSKLLTTGDVTTGFADLINNYGEMLGEGFNEYLDMAKQFVNEFNKIVSDGQLGSPITYTEIPAYASGTNFAQGGASLVGENGPEIVSLPRGSRVYTASQTSRMLNHLTSSGGSGNSVNVGTVVINEPNNFDGFVNEFCSQLNLPKPVKLTP